MPTHNNMSTSGSFVSIIQQQKVNILDLRQYDPVCLFGRTIKTSSHITPLKVFLKGSYGISSVFVEIFEGSLRWPMLRTSNHTNLCYFLKGFPSFEVGHMTLPRKIHDVGPMGQYKWPGDFGAQTQTKMVTDAAYIARSLMFLIQIHRTQVFWHISFQNSPIRYEVSRIFYFKKSYVTGSQGL